MEKRQENDAAVGDRGVDESVIPCPLCGKIGCSDKNPICTSANFYPEEAGRAARSAGGFADGGSRRNQRTGLPTGTPLQTPLERPRKEPSGVRCDGQGRLEKKT